jgi:ribulose-5-phosphate 4-epimerase/fuculose-1-phosphate aldolase
MTDQYIEYKKQVLECAASLSANGYFGAQLGTGGNVSMRISGQKAIAVTPSTIPYSQLGGG